ncbi:hypothetical protein BOTBODRAFT_174413 [Botryobasidium botryosum FD-172 SS1]|uniref:Uncharacterized protein n=1 Tax=Botryobasidium botryosum (strain FD-172 SS1) TaxID=930990 RepID=A0A067MGI4_BOTB1|nr:hypothetical protein BOTBODRAFT_174413 [Botryobasidium botryosum FD-172 SS1]
MPLPDERNAPSVTSLIGKWEQQHRRASQQLQNQYQPRKSSLGTEGVAASKWLAPDTPEKRPSAIKKNDTGATSTTLVASPASDPSPLPSPEDVKPQAAPEVIQVPPVKTPEPVAAPSKPPTPSPPPAPKAPTRSVVKPSLSSTRIPSSKHTPTAAPPSKPSAAAAAPKNGRPATALRPQHTGPPLRAQNTGNSTTSTSGVSRTTPRVPSIPAAATTPSRPKTPLRPKTPISSARIKVPPSTALHAPTASSLAKMRQPPPASTIPVPAGSTRRTSPHPRVSPVSSPPRARSVLRTNGTKTATTTASAVRKPATTAGAKKAGAAVGAIAVARDAPSVEEDVFIVATASVPFPTTEPVVQETEVIEEAQAPLHQGFKPTPEVDLDAVVMMLEGVNLIPPTPVAEDAPASNTAALNEKLSPDGYVSTPSRISSSSVSVLGEVEAAAQHLLFEAPEADADAFEPESPSTPEIPDEITSD